MAKQKSEKTLAKEAKWKAAIEAISAKVNLASPHAFQCTLLPGKITSQYPTVHIRNARLSAGYAATLLALKKYLTTDYVGLPKYWMKLYSSFLYGKRLCKYETVKDLEIISPYLIGTNSKTIPIQSYSIQLSRGSTPSAETYVASSSFLDEATAMTWPDDHGRVVIYTHLASKFAREKFPKLAIKASDGLNRDALVNCTKWDLLADYITIRKDMHLPIPQKTVCDIVKAISINQANIELQKMKLSNSKGAW